MGWWKIDPETGMPTKDTSKISRPGSVCLNAIPGTDNDPDAYYTGDSPWDFAIDAAEQLRGLAGASAQFSAEEVIRLFFDRIVPAWIDPGKASGVLRIVDLLWADIDDIYEEDWERKARPSEKRIVGEQVARCLIGKEED